MKENSERGSRAKKTPPLVVGTGLVALDVVVSRISGKPPRYWSGGTCGNVLTVLSYLGWKAQPVARLGTGIATDLVVEDLKRWNVSDRFIRVDDDGRTPVIVERITKNIRGVPRHSFSWRCTECGAPFPGYRAELGEVAEEIATQLGQPQVFFFDRVSSGALILARACAEAGGLIVFEPSGVGNPILFRRAWQLAHVVKYSHERLSELPEMDTCRSPRLQIETLGDEGLRYRRTGAGNRPTRWIELKSLPVPSVKDTAGAGDWCTAGLLSRVGREGLQGFLKITDQQLREALRYGQALSAWNCAFEGARGGMYVVSRRVFADQISKIESGVNDVKAVSIEHLESTDDDLKTLCNVCDVAIATKARRTTATST
ncbi:MAG: PfkB family carbohydrate kinase [Planctomycetales bacterium]